MFMGVCKHQLIRVSIHPIYVLTGCYIIVNTNVETKIIIAKVSLMCKHMTVHSLVADIPIINTLNAPHCQP